MQSFMHRWNATLMDCLVVGIGGAGSRLAALAARRLDADCVVISADVADQIPGCRFIHVECDMLANPSVHAIRGEAHTAIAEMGRISGGYGTIFLVANLAGRSGAALGPLASQLFAQRRLVSFVVMPFGYEEDRLFQAGISLTRIRNGSYSTVILDNDSMLKCNPELAVESCYEAGNEALVGAMGLTGRAVLAGDCVVSAGPESTDADKSLRDSIKMLYETALPHSVKGSILYMSGNFPVGVVETISRLTRGITDAPVAVVAETSSRSGVVLVSATHTLAKFEGYDPLAVIPKDHTIDWDEPEMSVRADLGLYQLE